MESQKIIFELSKKRYAILEDIRSYWDEDLIDYSIDTSSMDKEVDSLGDQIYIQLKDNFDELPFEFILEELTRLGHAPCLVYDDNGHFAVSGDGFNPIIDEEEMEDEENPFDFEMTIFCNSSSFKKTPREALKHYLFSEE